MTTPGAVLRDCAARHRRPCPRQVLGARLGLLAGALLSLEVPQSDKRLLTIVETDGCFVDGISTATGCAVGRRGVRRVAEAVRPEWSSVVREAWGLRLVDMYSAKEAGYLALQCPDHDHYHVQEENVLLEVLDGQGRPCAPGETGRVVVTALHKFAMPLIRYDIGDYAIVGEPCSCGRGLGVIREILGRTRNMMRLPNGDQRWPLCDLVHQPDVPGVMQYQYIQKTLESIEVHLAVDAQFSRDREPRLTEIIHARLGHPFALTYVYHDSIPRSASGKFEDFRCEIAEA